MFEYSIYNTKTGEEDIIFGYSISDAFRRYSSYDPNDWEVVFETYID